MPPKKAAAAATKKAPSSATHGTYKDMIKDAIVQLKDRMGSSRQAIKKYVAMNNNLGSTTEAALSKHISQALASGEKTGDFVRPKGPSGPVKLGKGTKPATKKTTTPKTTTTKKPAATKKAASTTTKAATTTKKAASSTKANSAKPRKSAPKKPAAAPAVDDKKPTVIGKTKSGRVQKTTAPQPAKTSATKKKPATKKATKAAA